MNRAEKRRQKKLAQKAAAKEAAGPSPRVTGPSAENLSQLFGQAVQFYQAGQFNEAGALYQQILDINPDLAEVHCNLGSVRNNLGDKDAAERSHRRAIALKPGYADAHGNLGNVLSDLGRLDEAIACYERALTHNPEDANIHNSLGSALQELDRHDDAIQCFETALSIEPDFAEAHGNLGISLKETDRPDEALASYERALALRPDFAEAHSNMGNALKDLGRLDDAAACYKRALAIRPGYAQARSNLGNVLTYMGQLDEALACYEQALADKPDHRLAANNYLHTLLYKPDVSNDDLFDAYRRMAGDRKPVPETVLERRLETPPETGARLRVGYLSSDFRDHPLGHNVLPLIANHDHQRHEIFCYAELSTPDHVSLEFQNHADHWCTVQGLADGEVAERIRADGVHVLVYLGGQFDENRPTVAVHRPAPVQVSLFAGTTTAIEGMDYWLTDGVLHPDDTTERFTEDLYRLPSLFTYPRPEHTPPVSGLPADENGYVTFASFNKPSKMNDRVLDLWAEVLGAVPDARLMLKFKNYLASPTISRRILTRFEKNGIAPDRIRLLCDQDSFQDHLARYAEADIALDTFPFSGATTTFQALWMGVPVLSLMGDRFIARMGGSLTAQAGLQSVTAETAEEFVALAAALAGDRDRLRDLRATLRQRIGTSSLCDGPVYARNVEAAFRDMRAAQTAK